MASSQFSPSDLFDKNKERDWAANLGIMDWDSTKIVFTKRTLIEFLKSIGITVDPHFANIQKLPRYAEFGKISGSETEATNTASARGTLKPSTSGRIFGEEDDDDALATAPSQQTDAQTSTTATTKETEKLPADELEEVGFNFTSSVKPSRRVRTAPGGTDNISSLLDSSGAQEEFKPTRRVRQGPGGQDNISSFF